MGTRVLCVIAVVATSTAVACGTTKPTPLVWTAPLVDPEPQPAVSAFALLPDDVRADVEAAFKRTIATTETDTFDTWLSQVDAVGARAATEPMSGSRVAALYSGRVSGAKVLPICFRYKAGGGSETAATGLSDEPSACNTDRVHVAVLTLRDVTIERSRSKVIEENACAVNTFAHERAHAVVQPDAMVFLDDGHHKQSNPVASYVIGALAQCLYLEEQYESQVFDIKRCVEEVGTNSFDPASCTKDWGRKFLSNGATAKCD